MHLCVRMCDVVWCACVVWCVCVHVCVCVCVCVCVLHACTYVHVHVYMYIRSRDDTSVTCDVFSYFVAFFAIGAPITRNTSISHIPLFEITHKFWYTYHAHKIYMYQPLITFGPIGPSGPSLPSSPFMPFGPCN